MGAWPLSDVPSVPVLQKLRCHVTHDTARTSHAWASDLYACGAQVPRSCSTPVPAESMHGQPLTDRLPVYQILGSKDVRTGPAQTNQNAEVSEVGRRRGRTAVPESGATRPVSIKLTARCCAVLHR